MHPFDTSFNVTVRRMAELVCPAGFDVAHDNSAPSTLEALQDHVARTGRILVDGSSDNTIFACPEANYAFRAWHDWTHLTIAAPFTLDGELAVAHRQIQDIARVYGHGVRADACAKLIMSEVYGQARYFAAYGEFPIDRRAFALAWLEYGRVPGHQRECITTPANPIVAPHGWAHV